MEGGIGLTIRQFGEKYKECLDKRKKQEQWILNLRYPDRSANEYLEYLQNCTDCNKDPVHWPFNNVEGKYLYQHLVNTVGTEIDIRTRQRLFIIKAMIEKENNHYPNRIVSGSLAEGLDLPGSDIDELIIPDIEMVIQNAQNIKLSKHCSTIVMETDTDYPGFTRLKVIWEMEPTHKTKFKKYGCESTSGGKYASVVCFFNRNKKVFQLYLFQPYQHGPCISNIDQSIDIAFCLKSEYFPDQAISWSFRDRNQWPPKDIIDRITNDGCLFVPIGPRTAANNRFLWRKSFSLAEKKLVHSFNYTQLLCYGLLKLTLRHINSTHEDVKVLLCSYFLKTALFWVSEETDINTFQLSKLFDCFFLCLNKLRLWVKTCYCPNYFIPKNNMFLGKITMGNNKKLLKVLDKILTNGIDGLRKNLFSPPSRNYHLVRTKSETVSINLDILFYRICNLTNNSNIEGYKKLLVSIESLLKSEKSAFIIGVCNYYYAKISQLVAHLLPPPPANGLTCNINEEYQKHLEHGTNADATSGLLLYASYFYVTGQYKETLILVVYVLSIYEPDFIALGYPDIDERNINNYIKRVNNIVDLNAKMNISTMGCVAYTRQSSLMPLELKLGLENCLIIISTDILSLVLNFLCYHHLNDISNRKLMLSYLHYIFAYNHLNAQGYYLVKILEICDEISGDNDRADQCYEEALHCNTSIFQSAEKRISKLPFPIFLIFIFIFIFFFFFFFFLQDICIILFAF